MSEKLHERVGSFLGVFLEDPVSGVLEHDGGHIRSYQLHLLGEEFPQGVFAPDGQDGHGELGLRELGEILRGLWERNEVAPAGSHTTWARVGCGVRFPIGFRKRARLIGGEIFPTILEINPPPSFHAASTRLPVHTEMPAAFVVPYPTPPTSPAHKPRPHP